MSKNIKGFMTSIYYAQSIKCTVKFVIINGGKCSKLVKIFIVKFVEQESLMFVRNVSVMNHKSMTEY